MGLFKRGNFWWIQLRFNGSLVRESTHTSNKKLADQRQSQLKLEMALGRFGLGNQGIRKTFQELATKYMHEEAGKKTVSSQRRDKTSLKVLLPFFGERILTQITPNMINDYKLIRKAKGRQPATINRELALAKRMFNVSIRVWGWAGDNPFLKVPMETIHNERIRFLTDTEFQALLNASDDWLRPLITVAAFTGLRKTNLLELEWKEVDFGNEWITVLHTKNHQPYGVPMLPIVRDTLRELSRVRHLNGTFVFTNHDGSKVKETKLQKHFKQACKKADITNLRWHDLRHCFGSWLTQCGVDPYAIKTLMGHKDFKTTQRYAHQSPRSLKEAIMALGQTVITKAITVNN